MKTLALSMQEHVSLSIESTIGYDFIDSDHWAFWKEGFNTVLITDTVMTNAHMQLFIHYAPL